MQKSIHLDSGAGPLVRVLSITDPVEGLVIDGREYIIIDTYEEPPVKTNDMQELYAFYNKETGDFKWVLVDYQVTSSDYALQVEQLTAKIESQDSKIAGLEASLAEYELTMAEAMAAVLEK